MNKKKDRDLAGNFGIIRDLKQKEDLGTARGLRW